MATAFLPYTIGKSAIVFVEEFNVRIDEETVVGLTEISAVEECIRADGKRVRGTAVISSNQLFEGIDEQTVLAIAVVSSEDKRYFEQTLGTVIGVAEISSNELFGSSILAGVEIEGALAINKTLGNINIDAFSTSGLTGGLSVRPRYPKAYRNRGYFVNSSYEIIGINISDLLGAGDIVCEPEIYGNLVIANVLNDNFIFPESYVVGEIGIVHGPVEYIDSNTVYGQEEIYSDIEFFNFYVEGKAVIFRSFFEVIGVGIPELVNEPIVGSPTYAWAVESYKPDFFGANIIAPPNNGTSTSVDLTVSHTLEAIISVETIVKLRATFNNDRSRYGGEGYPPGDYYNPETDGGALYWAPRGSEPDTDIGGGNYDRTLGGYSIGQVGVSGTLS